MPGAQNEGMRDGQKWFSIVVCVSMCPKNSTTESLMAGGKDHHQHDRPEAVMDNLYFRDTGNAKGRLGLRLGGSFSVSCVVESADVSVYSRFNGRRRYPRSLISHTHASTDPSPQPSSAYHAARVAHPPESRAGLKTPTPEVGCANVKQDCC
jgi:hypothetical protein